MNLMIIPHHKCEKMDYHSSCAKSILKLDDATIVVNIFNLSVFHLSTQINIIIKMKNTTIKIFWVGPKNVE